jgi:hypothetical protein
MGIRCRGLGKSVPGKLACIEGQSTAHGQITERKYSVPWFRLSLACGPTAIYKQHSNYRCIRSSRLSKLP